MRIHPDGLGFTLLLGALAGLPALSIDMSLPALPEIRAALGADAAAATATLSMFLLGFGTAQLVIGPVSDRIGRRPVLTMALVLYVIGGIASGFAPSIALLLAARCLQGAGAAGGTVLAFAIIRDLFVGEAARARLSTVSLVFSIAPVIAPTLGGAVMMALGWRGIFVFQLLTGVALAAVTLLGLPETRRDLPPPPFLAILGERRTVAFGVVGALNLGNVFCVVAGAPMLLLGPNGVSTTMFGAIFALITAGVLAGAWINRLAVHFRWSAVWPMGIGLGGATLGALGGTLAGGARLASIAVLVPIFLLATLSRGLVSPNVTHAALERIPAMAGAGSALIGAMQMLTGACAGVVVGIMFDRYGPDGLMMTMAGFAVPAFLAWVYVERNYR